MSRRAQKKAEVRESLVEAADRLFAEHGFEATTVDDIAEEAGVSRRTFFRYFPAKEAIAFPNVDARLALFQELLSKSLETSSPFEAVRESIFEVGKLMMAMRGLEFERQRVIEASPTLLAAELGVYRRWEHAIAEAAAPKNASQRRRRRARLFAGATMGIVRAVLAQWFRADGKKDVLALGREAFSALEDGFADFR